MQTQVQTLADYRAERAYEALVAKYGVHRARCIARAHNAGLARILAGEPVAGESWWLELAPLTRAEREAVRSSLTRIAQEHR